MFDDSFDNTLEAYASCDCPNCECLTSCDCGQNWDCGSDISSTSSINDVKKLAPSLYPNTVVVIATSSRTSK